MTCSPTPASRAAAAPSSGRPSRRAGPARLGAQYEANLGGSGFLTFGGAGPLPLANRAGGRQHLCQSARSARRTGSTGLFQNGYALVDARIVYETANRRYNIGVYANNLIDEAYKTDGQEFSSIGSIRTVYYGAPRTFMVRAGVRF